MAVAIFSNFVERYLVSQPRFREWLTKRIYGQKDRTVSLFHRSVAINTLRENGYYRASRLSRRSSLLRDEVVIFSRLPHFFAPGTTFVDVGANIGIFSIMMAPFQKLLPGFRVIAFEVHPGTFARLEQNARTHGFVAHNVGISSTPATRSFVEGAVSHVTRLSEDTNRYIIANRGFEARCERLDSFDLSGDIVMKIDVEGHEYDVLAGSERYFDEGRVRAVYIDGYNDERVPDFLRRHGFTLRDCSTLEPVTEKPDMLLATKD